MYQMWETNRTNQTCRAQYALVLKLPDIKGPTNHIMRGEKMIKSNHKKHGASQQKKKYTKRSLHAQHKGNAIKSIERRRNSHHRSDPIPKQIHLKHICQGKKISEAVSDLNLSSAFQQYQHSIQEEKSITGVSILSQE